MIVKFSLPSWYRSCDTRLLQVRTIIVLTVAICIVLLKQLVRFARVVALMIVQVHSIDWWSALESETSQCVTFGWGGGGRPWHFGAVVRVLYSLLGFYLSTIFEKATALCIVVILFHVGFELIFLCDIMGRGGIPNVTMTLSVPKMVWRCPLRPSSHTCSICF